MKRLFVAVSVSEEVKERIKPVLSELSQTGADLKLVSLTHLHFTLKFLGDVEEKKIPEIEKKLAGIAENAKSFDVSVKGVGVFPSLERINVVWAGIEDSSLVDLMKIVGKELDFAQQSNVFSGVPKFAKANFKDIRENDHGKEVAHLTIARVKTGRNKEKLQEFVKKFQKKEFGSIKVDKITLYESELGREGAVHKVVREFELK